MPKKVKPVSFKQVFVKPAAGCKVHYEPPMRGFLKEEGESVSLTPYWRRRIKMVDVVKCKKRSTKSDAPPRTDADASKKGKDSK